jgi:hypothetical protein
MIEIIKRHMVGGQQHEHIGSVKYLNAQGVEKEATRQAMVDWLDDKTKTNSAIVYSRDRKTSSYVGVVHRTGAPDYIRTHADGKWTDNLLALDTY